MAWAMDPFLLELFDSLQKELAAALEARQRRREMANDDCGGLTGGETRKIDSLKGAIAALQGALERREKRIVH